LVTDRQRGGGRTQTGKAIISMPMIRTDMAFGLDLAGLIVATSATLGTFFGFGALWFAGRVSGDR
jgi:hypothetical protein